ncbi:unnamed protein product, partial [marine sediment metagenome]
MQRESSHITTDYQTEDALGLEQIARIGAQRMLAIALEAEVDSYIQRFSHLKTREGKQDVVRNGYHNSRKVMTGLGALEVTVPRTRSREVEIERFSSALVPKYMRRSLELDDALPLFYLGGLSNNDFIPCFEKLFGQKPDGMSSSSITRLKKAWQGQMMEWRKRDLSDCRYCYLWVDGIHFNLRLEEGR